MTVGACAELVARADPDRYAAALAAPVAARAVLLPLFAFNVEVSRAPWVTSEPMIAEMRLQWWRDALEEIAGGAPVRAHEVATPLAAVLAPGDARLLDGAVAARRWDVYTDAFPDAAAFDAYIDATSGHLAWVAARRLGAAPEAEAVVRDHAYAAGLAAFLRAIPELEARGRKPLPDGRPEAVRALADRGLARLSSARAGRRRLAPAAAPALYPGWQAGPILTQAAAEPGRVAEGALGTSEFVKRLGLVRLGLTGRW